MGDPTDYSLTEILFLAFFTMHLDASLPSNYKNYGTIRQQFNRQLGYSVCIAELGAT